MPKEKYIPSQEEVQKAEEMMSPEQKEASEIREMFKTQERDPFEDFLAHIDEGDKRMPPTPEEKKRMDYRLKKLGQIFEGYEGNWHLDGALNISLMKGEYIGTHKDVDISVEDEDLDKLDAQAAKKGYGLFLSRAKDPTMERSPKINERVGAQRFREAGENEHWMLAAIDEQGKIREEEEMNFIDVHVIQRNTEGKPIGQAGVELPEEWLESRTIDFQGEKLNISNPVKVAYFKLHQGRSYDYTDLEELAKTGELTEKNVEDIKGVIKKEVQKKIGEFRGSLGDTIKDVKPGMSVDEIYSVFLSNEFFKARLPRIEEPLKKLSEKIAKDDDLSLDKIWTDVEDAFKVQNYIDQELEKTKGLEAWVKEAEEKKKLEDELK
ncbi:MAG: hypothetical protein KKD35_03685 [Elusimicrobia bacterium]|nr:hypothetical protein [Elusimicrobiota bacterium]